MCDFVVFDQSWTKTRELTSDHCSTGHRRLAMVGGMSHADTNSDQFQDAMKYVASQVDLQSNGLYRSSPVHYSHCFQQVCGRDVFYLKFLSILDIVSPNINFYKNSLIYYLIVRSITWHLKSKRKEPLII